MFVKTPTFDNNEITLSAFRSCQNVIFVGNIDHQNYLKNKGTQLASMYLTK